MKDLLARRQDVIARLKRQLATTQAELEAVAKIAAEGKLQGAEKASAGRHRMRLQDSVERQRRELNTLEQRVVERAGSRTSLRRKRRRQSTANEFVPAGNTA